MTLWIDIFVDGMFYCQVPFDVKIYDVPSDEKMRDYCLQKVPSLKGKKFSIALGERISKNNR